MPNYHYQCSQCSHEFQTLRSIKDPILTRCPECRNETLRTVIYAVTVVDTTPRTLGSQADRNFSKAGAYEREARQKEIADARIRAKTEADKLPPGMESARNDNPVTPWWRPGTTGPDTRLASLSPKEKERYAIEGKV
jgi:putative FmdB family regulatory protein